MDYKKIDKQYCSTPLSGDPSRLYRIWLEIPYEGTPVRQITKPVPAKNFDDSTHNQANGAAKVEASEDSEPQS